MKTTTNPRKRHQPARRTTQAARRPEPSAERTVLPLNFETFDSSWMEVATRIARGDRIRGRSL